MASGRRAWIPNQHGAWAMLVTPVIVGALLSGPVPWHLLLGLAWLSAYCAHYFAGLAVKSHRFTRYRAQILTYGVVCAVLAVPLAAHEPRLLLLAPAALLAFAVNIAFILRRNERAWINDAVGIALASLVGVGAVWLGTTPALTSRAIAVIAVIALYFLGTVVYVKTLIRERGSVAWLRASWALHAAFVAAAAIAGWWAVVAVSAGLLARSAIVPGRRWSPKRVGLVEIGWTVLVAVVALATIGH